MGIVELTPTDSHTTPVPPLCTGDRLTRAQFEARYAAMPRGTKAELIEGVAYIMNPVTADNHGEPHFDFNGWLFLYRAQTPMVRGGDNSSLRLDPFNEYQPDGYLRLLPEYGGRSKIVDGYLEGAPELVLEISASTVSYDLHDKLKAYQRHGVNEYIVWRVWDEAIDWFVLVDNQYEQLAVEADGIHRSRVFPGLWLDSKAVLTGDVSRVIQVLQTGTQSTEHKTFLAKHLK
jgi:Uma2 family endonuclease